MKDETRHSDNDNPVINAVFIGLYFIALVILLVILARRFLPFVEGIMAM
ncbi:MAG: hypothetical protein LUE10_00760 [Alistipes sp.]|nr:hypothetical protein [Alistipes sp.]